MTIYVLDTSSLINFRHYYQERFPSLWEKFHAMVRDDRITSTREVRSELLQKDDLVAQWAGDNIDVFPTPSEEEGQFVRRIFAIRDFQNNIGSKERLKGAPVADPFVIARAKCLPNGCVVTEEKLRDEKKPSDEKKPKKATKAAKIPNICQHFGIECINLEKFMQEEEWKF